MLIGAHSILYSTHPEQDRAFLRDVLGLPHVDVGEGWLIFGLPPSEVAIHPSDENDVHELYLMVDDIQGFVKQMAASGIVCSPVSDQGYGLVIQLTLPGGGKLGVYEPRHARPVSFKAERSRAARGAAKRARPGSSGRRKATKGTVKKDTRRSGGKKAGGKVAKQTAMQPVGKKTAGKTSKKARKKAPRKTSRAAAKRPARKAR